jgi:multisubunit Na+/H+ antiporter MnhG subunit
VSVVQALQVTSLLFTLPLSTLGRPEKPRARDWLGGGCIVGGLIVFLAARGSAHGVGSAHRDRFLFILLVLLATVIGLAVLAGLRSGPLRATLLACAAGASFAASASLVKLTSDDLVSRGVAATATDWPGYALAVVSVLGVLLQQVAFASGRLPVAATAMIVANPVTGTAIAIVAFAEALPSEPVRLAGLAVGAVLVIVGVALLSHSPLLTGRGTAAADRPDPAVQPATR